MSATEDLHPDDHYRLVALLGEGSRSRVFLADDTAQAATQVAIKFLRQDQFPDAKLAVDHLNHESQCLTLSAHANVVARISSNTNSEGRPYLIMERLRGKSLKQIFSESALDINTIFNLFIPLTHALEHMHKVGVLHFDLRPDKIIVEQVDKKLVPKLIGFGRARYLPWSGREQSTEPFPKGDMYSLQYASPEEAMDKRGLPASDVYSLGLILFEALTGRQAIQGENELHVMAQHISGTTQAPSVVKGDPNLRKYDEVVLQSIAKETHRRFVDAAEFREALNQVAPAQSGWLARLFKK